MPDVAAVPGWQAVLRKPAWLWRFQCYLVVLEWLLRLQKRVAASAACLSAMLAHGGQSWRGLLSILATLRAEIQEHDNVDVATDDDIHFASSAARAVLHQDPRGARQILLLTALFLLVCLVWMAFAKVDERARGSGKVIPSARLQVIQNLEGGIVAELYVREGQQVAREQPLLRIDDTQFSSSLREQQQQRAYLRVKTARLRAEIAGEPFSAQQADLQDVDAALLTQEVNLYQSRQQDYAGQLRVLDEQVVQKGHELDEIKSRVGQLARSYELAAQELRMTEPLVPKGAISEVEVLRLRRETLELKGQLDVARLEVSKVEAGLQEVQNKRDSFRLQVEAKAQQELNEAAAELGKLEESRDALADRVRRTTVRAPVAGQINRLLVNTIGGVVQPGMDLVEIVPGEDSLLVEARMSPVDIAYLHPGQQAMVKVTAYDFTIYGGLDGRVVHISPDSLVDDKGNSYYVVRVETERHFLGKLGQRLEIMPGMTVEVDVLTGEKTVLSYLLKPILRAKERAFSER